MSNRSTTTYTIGKLESPHLAMCIASLINDLEFDTTLSGTEAILYDIKCVGPAVVVTDDGRWGAQIRPTDASFEKLKQGILIVEHFDAFSTVYRTTYIGGEEVHSEEIDIDAAHVHAFPTGFVPRNEVEKDFFDALKEAQDKYRADRSRQWNYKRMERLNPELHAQVEAYHAHCSAMA